MSMWSSTFMAGGVALIGAGVASGMPASPSHTFPSGLVMGAGVFSLGIGGALTMLE